MLAGPFKQTGLGGVSKLWSHITIARMRSLYHQTF